MYHPYEPIMYSNNNIFKLNDIPHQCFLKAGISEINKTQEYSNYLQDILRRGSFKRYI